jgi:hypothetical protein
VQALGPKVFVEVKRDLAVRAGTEAVSPAAEVLANLLEVIELAIGHDPERLILVRYGLRASTEVDDREPGMAEPDPAIGRDPVSPSVGTAMMQGRRAAMQCIGRDGATGGKHSGDAAHVRAPVVEP